MFDIDFYTKITINNEDKNNLKKYYQDLDNIFFNENKKFTQSVETKFPVVKQFNTNLCWATSAVATFLFRFLKDNNVKYYSISMAYILFWSYIEKIDKLFENIETYRNSNIDLIYQQINNGIDDSGNWRDFKNIILKYGSVPEKLMKNTYLSKNTDQINLYLTRFVRINALKFFKTNDPKIRTYTLTKAYQFLCKCLGEPPKIVNDKIKTLKNDYIKIKNKTPQEFAQLIFKDITNYNQVIAVQNTDFQKNTCYVDIFNEKLFCVDFNELKSLIKNQLKGEKSVIIGIDCRYGVDYKNNMFVYYPKKFKKLLGLDIIPNRKYGFDTNILKINHNSILFDYKKINNKNYWISHDNFFSLPICYMTEKWFDNFVFEAIIDTKYLDFKNFTQKPLTLNSNF